MASPVPHPRRRYPSQLSSRLDVSSTFSNSSLKKSATFHSPTSPHSTEHDPILSVPSLPRRSPTCSKDLELAIAAAGDNRITQVIGAVDRSFSDLESFSSNSEATLISEDIPVPRFLVNTISDSDLMDVDSTPTPSQNSPGRKHHASDSGIGSTETGSVPSISGDHSDMKQALLRNNSNATANTPLKEGRVKTGINGLNMAPADPAAGPQRALSEYACKMIQKHIIIPIIREEKLKNFHPLVSGIPYRVARKEITCLRDLEKVLLWLAPKWSVSKASFLYFCETSIQCIHTTVDYLNENDQRRPTDRPYTNGYFLDLVEQVRQYASVLAASRARMASNTEAREGDATSEERIGLVGGLSQTGRPAELVRIKDGKSISLRTGEEISSEEYKHGLKRSIDGESEEDVLRSMARRRKSAGPVVKEEQKCHECNKVFKRPCDLTKHEKTHSRPWKCSEVNCKYHEYGWPTEKERDRHVNDKHSAAPSMFKCRYHPCPYESKRESNCKQHMEKAHGWVYVRSKNNGKTKGPSSTKTPPTPQLSTPGSHIFSAPTPDLTDNSLYYDSPSDHHRNNSLHGSIMTPDMSAQYANDMVTFAETFGPIDPTFQWNDVNEFGSGSVTEYTNSSHRPSWDSAMANPSVAPSTFDNPLPADEESLFGPNFDWSNMDHDYTSLNIQLITPATSVEQRPLDAFSRDPSVCHDSAQCDQPPSLSPGAQGDTMLYSPYSMQSNEGPVDEGYAEYTGDIVGKPMQDFALFGADTAPSTTNGAMFEDLANFPIPSGWSGRGQELAQQLGMGADLMQMED